MQNNFAKLKPTVVLFAPEGQDPKALMDGEKPMVFKNWSKATKHVSRFIDPAMWPHIRYVNETPVMGAGDREETGNRKCLKCKGFLRPSHEVATVSSPTNQMLQIEEFVCPKCDLGEK